MARIYFKLVILTYWFAQVQAAMDMTYFLNLFKGYDIDLTFWTETNSNFPVEYFEDGHNMAASRYLGCISSIGVQAESCSVVNVIINPKDLNSLLVTLVELFQASSGISDFSNSYLQLLQNIFIIFCAPDSIETMPGNLSFYLNSQIYFAVGTDFENPAEIWEIYYIKNTRVVSPLLLNGTSFGLRDEIYRLVHEPLVWRRSNFHGVPITAAGVCEGSYDEECTWDPVANTFGSGFAVSVYWDLKDSYNFSDDAKSEGGFLTAETWNRTYTETRLSADNSTAWNFTYRTNAGKLAYGEWDLVISQNVHRPDLVQFFTIPQPTYSFGLIAFFEQPYHTKTSLFVIPFQTKVWLSFAVFWAMIGLLTGIIECTERFYLLSDEKEEDDEDLITCRPAPSVGVFRAALSVCSDLLYGLAATISQKGLSALPLLFKSRYAFAIPLFASILWNAAYQAGFVSTLAVQEKPIKFFTQLIDEGYKFVIPENSASIPTFVNLLFEALNISESRKKDLDDISAFKSLSGGTHAYLQYFDTFHGLLHEDFQKLGILNPDYHFCHYISAVNVDKRKISSGFVLSKHSPYREHFNLKIIQLKEKGLHFKYLRTYQQSTQPRCLPRHDFWSDLDLIDVAYAFYTVFSGAALAILFLLFEILAARGLTHRKK